MPPTAAAHSIGPLEAHLAFVDDIEAAGARSVVEHGVVTGEVRGLEVCRVVDVDTGDGAAVRLEVGVGPHDREAFAVIHGDVPTREALAGVVAAVGAARGVDAPGHPLNRLAPERLLRWRLEQEPWLVGHGDGASRPSRRCHDAASSNDRPAPRSVDASTALRSSSCAASGSTSTSIPYAADARLCGSGGGRRRGGSGSPVRRPSSSFRSGISCR